MWDLQQCRLKLGIYEKQIEQSALYEHTTKLLRETHVDRIRCLALGSPTLEFQALYQLAYLNLLVRLLKIDPKNVSLYDPAFTPGDEQLIISLHSYVIQSLLDSQSSQSNTLFYMPHAPRSVTEETLVTHKPKWLLANDIRVTIGTMGKAQFLEKFPNLAKLAHLAELSADVPADVPADEFVPVVSRRKNKNLKNVFVEPVLKYDLEETYFSGIEITRLTGQENAQWRNSFSDLALNVVS